MTSNREVLPGVEVTGVAAKVKVGRPMLLAARGTIVAAAAVGAILLVAPMLRTPSSGPMQVADDDKPAATAAGGVELDRASQQKGGIEAVTPTETPFRDEVRAYGTVLALDRLVGLYNASLTDTAQLQAALAKQGESRSAEARAATLLKAFPSAKAQADAASATAEIDTAGVTLAKAQIEALRNSAIQEWGPTLGAALVARSAPASDLVAGRARLVLLSVAPGRIVAPPARLAFTLGDAPPIEGRFLSDSVQADPKMQSIGYLYVVPAAPGLVPGTSLLATLPKGAAQAGIDIPPSAVVWQAGKPWVYLRTAPDHFERRALAAAEPTAAGGYVVPARSLDTRRDAALVTAGAQVLLSQEMRAQIPSDGDDN